MAATCARGLSAPRNHAHRQTPSFELEFYPTAGAGDGEFHRCFRGFVAGVDNDVPGEPGIGIRRDGMASRTRVHLRDERIERRVGRLGELRKPAMRNVFMQRRAM